MFIMCEITVLGISYIVASTRETLILRHLALSAKGIK